MSPSVSIRLLLTQSDARLLAYARAGHERAFEALVRRYRAPLLGYCRRLLLSDERAEDALQQALTQAWLALRGGTEVENVRGWLYRIVHNSALNALRVSGYDYCTLSESLSGADAPQEDLDRRIAVREALAGLAALPEMQREALLRTAVEGSSHQQAARELGLSETAVRGLVYRARATLRAAAGAIVPPPMVSWALESGGGGPVSERLGELGAGGSAGVAGLLLKGGAAAVTTAVLASGIAPVRVHPKHVGGHAASKSARSHAHVEATRVALEVSRSARSITPVSDVLTAPEHAKSLLAHQPMRSVERSGRHLYKGRVLAEMAPAAGPRGPNPRGRDDLSRGQGRSGDSGDGPRNPGAKDPAGGTDAKGDGDGGGGGGGRGGGGHSAMSSNGSGPGGSDRSSEGDASGSSSTGGGQDGGRIGSGSGRAEQISGTSPPGGSSSGSQGALGTPSAITSGSSKGGQGSESGKEN